MSNRCAHGSMFFRTKRRDPCLVCVSFCEASLHLIDQEAPAGAPTALLPYSKSMMHFTMECTPWCTSSYTSCCTILCTYNDSLDEGDISRTGHASPSAELVYFSFLYLRGQCVQCVWAQKRKHQISHQQAKKAKNYRDKDHVKKPHRHRHYSFINSIPFHRTKHHHANHYYYYYCHIPDAATWTLYS